MRRQSLALPVLRVVAVLLALLAPAAPGAWAGSIVVTNLNDVAAGSLRQAIQDHAPGDTIRFATGLTGTITNLGAPWQVFRPVTIVGPGAGVLALSGADARSLFIITNGEVRISGLTLRNGYGLYGSAITSNDTLRVSRCTFRSNRGTGGGGALRATGVLEVTECTFESNVSDPGTGGAIQTAAYSIVTGSTFRANVGGALEASATLQLVNSTFNGNSNSYGGALRLLGTPQIVFDCTIAGNSASVNGGGVYASGTFPHLQNTIIAGNSGPNPDFSGTVYSSSHCLIGNPAGSSGFGAAGSYDQVGAVGNPIDPNLAPIGDYGGPTWTMPPRPGSPAVDQGDSGHLVDQRGRGRFYDHPLVLNAGGGDASDIGAYELRPGLLTVTTLADAGPGSLRQAVADLHPYDADSIQFAPSVRGTITLTSGVITTTKPGVIDGPSSWELAVSGNAAGRVFVVQPNVSFAIQDLTITGGRETEGAAILAHGSLSLRNCRITGNHFLQLEFSLGGIVRKIPPGHLEMENCTIANNTTGFGGGVLTGQGPSFGGTTVVANCTFSGNSGAGLVSTGPTTTVLNSTFSNNNTVGYDGGGIWHLSGPAVSVGSTILAGNGGPADVAGAFSSLGYNLVGKGGTASGFTNGVNGDRIGTAASPIAPGLAQLLAGGGPGETHALLPGSIAIDKGRLFRLLDQRGAARYDDPAVVNEFDGSDIGAYERNPTSLVAVEPLPGEAGLALESPRPNPAASGITSFASRLDRSGPVLLGIYDVSGRRVRTLVAATRPAGTYRDAWDGKGDDGLVVASGVYFARLLAGEQAVSRRVVVVR